MEVTKNDLIYLYCITNREPRLKELESLVDRLYFICHEGLYAVVSKVRDSEFSEENLRRNLSNMEWVKIKVSIHEKIIEGVMENACVVPFKFATLFNTEDSLKAMLDKCKEELKENLKELKGKEEWGVKIYCNIEELKENLIQEDEELLKIDKEISSSLPGKAFFLMKKREELLNITATKKLNVCGQDSSERLSRQSLQSRINKLLPKEVTERKDDMILNSAFLVDKSKVAEFIHVANGLQTKYNDKGIDFDCTGPWPPYNFCSINRKEGKEK